MMDACTAYWPEVVLTYPIMPLQLFSWCQSAASRSYVVDCLWMSPSYIIQHPAFMFQNITQVTLGGKALILNSNDIPLSFQFKTRRYLGIFHALVLHSFLLSILEASLFHYILFYHVSFSNQLLNSCRLTENLMVAISNANWNCTNLWLPAFLNRFVSSSFAFEWFIGCSVINWSINKVDDKVSKFMTMHCKPSLTFWCIQ